MAASSRKASLVLTILSSTLLIAQRAGAEGAGSCSGPEKEESDQWSALQRHLQLSQSTDLSGSEPPTADGKPSDPPVTLRGPEQCAGTRLPFTEGYVVNMDMFPDRWKSFLEHMRTICGFDGMQFHRHSGILLTEELRASEWVRHYIPHINVTSTDMPGTIGSALAHIYVWDRIAHSDACRSADGGDNYALVLEDDEWPKENFEAHAQSLMRVLDALPSAEKPALVYLNTCRAAGADVATLEPEHFRLLEVQKSSPQNRPHEFWYDEPTGRHHNLWLSNYLVRCSSADSLVQYAGNWSSGKSFDGTDPVFDVHMNDIVSDIDVPLKAYVIAKQDAISYHPPSAMGTSTRGLLDKGREKAAAAAAPPAPPAGLSSGF